MDLLIGIGACVGFGTLVAVIFFWSTRPHGYWAALRLAQFGEPVGRTLTDISKALGRPYSTSPQTSGKVLHQWIQPGFHLALLFDADGVCERMTHRSGEVAQSVADLKRQINENWRWIVAVLVGAILLGLWLGNHRFV